MGSDVVWRGVLLALLAQLATGAASVQTPMARATIPAAGKSVTDAKSGAKAAMSESEGEVYGMVGVTASPQPFSVFNSALPGGMTLEVGNVVVAGSTMGDGSGLTGLQWDAPFGGRRPTICSGVDADQGPL